MKIAIDAMGGDYAPKNVILGVKDILSEINATIILVGKKDIIKEHLYKNNISNHQQIEIVDASQVVDMNDPSTIALKSKKDSSITVCMNLVKEGKAQGVVSAGHTGASVSSAVVKLRTISGIKRPAIATTLPTVNGNVLLLDAGANIECNPENLSQFALMGNLYSKLIYNKKNPRVGLLNVGDEDSKGSSSLKETFNLIQEQDLNFIGNIEGTDIYADNVDVAICDGFVGNIILKSSESLAKAFGKMLKTSLNSSLKRKLGALLAKDAFKEFKKKTDYAEYGGAPLLGVNGTCIICHGSSSPKAITNAIKFAHKTIEANLNESIQQKL